MTSVLPASGALRMTPARLLTLALGVPVILALIGWTGFTLVDQGARGSFPLSYAIAVQHGQLAVGVDSADITVRQGNASTARLDGTVHYGLFRPHPTRSVTASGTEVSVPCPDISSNCGLSATLEVPRLAGLTLSSGGGNLTVPGVAQTVDLTSDGGDVTVSGIPGPATVRTSGGNLTAGDLSGTGKFTTDGGDVTGNNLAAPTLSTDSGGGNVNLTFAKAPTNLAIISEGGDVNIILPRGAAAYRISTSADGGDDSVSVPTSSSSGRQITVDSGGGNITISEQES